MIAALCLAVAVCWQPPPTATADTLTVHAERAEAHAFMHEVARARQLIRWVDAVTEPEPAGPDTPATGSRPTVTASTPASEGTVNGYPCGGTLPPCTVLACESGGNPTAENPTSSASGLWQIIDGTWNNYGGYPHAASAPAEIQNQKAADLYRDGAGIGHWRQCT